MKFFLLFWGILVICDLLNYYQLLFKVEINTLYRKTVMYSNILHNWIKKNTLILHVKAFMPPNINQSSLDVTNLFRNSTVIHRKNTHTIKNLSFILASFATSAQSTLSLLQRMFLERIGESDLDMILNNFNSVLEFTHKHPDKRFHKDCICMTQF